MIVSRQKKSIIPILPLVSRVLLPGLVELELGVGVLEAGQRVDVDEPLVVDEDDLGGGEAVGDGPGEPVDAQLVHVVVEPLRLRHDVRPRHVGGQVGQGQGGKEEEQDEHRGRDKSGRRSSGGPEF